MINKAPYRLFNLRQGLDKNSDTLPSPLYKYFLSEQASLTKDELEYMLQEYYVIREWGRDGMCRT